MVQITPPDDLEIARAQKMDAVSLQVVLHKTAPYVLNLCKSWCRPPLESEDVAQETLITLSKNLGSYQSQSSFFTWVYTLCYRTFLDALRKEKRRDNIVKMENFQENQELIESQLLNSTDREDNDLEDIKALHKALENIGNDHAEILILIDVKEQSYASTAAQLGLPIGTVRSRLARARIALRNELLRNGTKPFTSDVSIKEDRK